MERWCIAVLRFLTLYLHGIRVISFVNGRRDAGDYVPDRSADIVCYRYLVDMQMGSMRWDEVLNGRNDIRLS